MTHILPVNILVQEIGLTLKQRHLQLVTAESCTGGQLAQTITSIPGASAWFERGFITYSNLSKQQLLGVKEITLTHYGPVSQETVLAMAQGALDNSAANVSIAITGIAGPDGGTQQSKVGTVYFAWVYKKYFCEAECRHYTGNRLVIRYEAVEFALKKLLHLLQVHLI